MFQCDFFFFLHLLSYYFYSLSFKLLQFAIYV